MKTVRIAWCFAVISSGLVCALGQPPGSAPVRISEDSAAGLELWQTALGRLWIPAPGADVIRHLQWEQAEQKVYDYTESHVRNGDIVIDAGAHIGAFTRIALQAGARMVIAIEPESRNLSAFRRNLATELKGGRVVLVSKGLWDGPGKLPLHISPVGDSHSIVAEQRGGREETIELIALDALVASLKPPRVDFLKMDIEGAEKKSLQGALQTLSRFHPRLAISSYHEPGDPAEICRIVWSAWPGYMVGSKDIIEVQPHKMVPKVLFFYKSGSR